MHLGKPDGFFLKTRLTKSVCISTFLSIQENVTTCLRSVHGTDFYNAVIRFAMFPCILKHISSEDSVPLYCSVMNSKIQSTSKNTVCMRAFSFQVDESDGIEY